jgi:MAF protein
MLETPVSPKFLLASSSPYRAGQFTQLGLHFEQFSPNVDESPEPNELPPHIAQRLSDAKALSAQRLYPDHIIIASDQVACLAESNQPFGKPLTSEKAVAQLSACSGKKVVFYSGLSVLVPETFASADQHKRHYTAVETYTVCFRPLSIEQIKQYIRAEQPLQCAGSFKAEGLGISLFDGFEGRDYNTLIGLPLMALNDIFFRIGIDVLALQSAQSSRL